MKFYIIEKIKKEKRIWVARSTVWWVSPIGLRVPIRSVKQIFSVAAYDQKFVASQINLLSEKARKFLPADARVPVWSRSYI